MAADAVSLLSHFGTETLDRARLCKVGDVGPAAAVTVRTQFITKRGPIGNPADSA